MHGRMLLGSDGYQFLKGIQLSGKEIQSNLADFWFLRGNSTVNDRFPDNDHSLLVISSFTQTV